LEIFNLPLLAK
jgi:hypothetical protein